MAGKRLLDVAALFNASRGVAQKHLALRARQVDVYSQTSTLAKAVKNQTDRVTETAKAASFLVSRLNESGPAWASEAEDVQAESRKSSSGPIPSKQSTEGGQVSKSKDGIDQDHFYERPTGNSTTYPPPGDDLEIRQEKAERYPLPDGTIPPSNSDLNTKLVDHEVLSARPQDESIKTPLENGGLRPTSSSASTIPLPARKPLSADSARKLQRQFELQIPSVTADALDDTIAHRLEKGFDEDSFSSKSTHVSPTLSSLPRVKLPEHTSDTQGESSSEHREINSDSFYMAGQPESSPTVEAIPVPDEIPVGVDTALFYSPRVARLLGGKTQRFKPGNLDLKGVKDTPPYDSNFEANKEQDTSNVYNSLEAHAAVARDAASTHKDLLQTSASSIEDKEADPITSQAPNITQVQVRSVPSG
jgi:aarF domain-containing kinase